MVDALIVDRQSLFLAALGRLLSSEPLACRVVSESRSDVALALLRAQHFDLVCCELHAQPLSGVELMLAIAEEMPEVRVILLGDLGDEVHLAGTLNAPVAGLFTKNADPVEFLAGVSAVLLGHRAVGSTIIRELLARPPQLGQSPRTGHQLSTTELEILAMIAQAKSIPTIAASRGISHKTVRNHLAKIYRKLDLHGKTEAMLWATRMGLTES